MSQQVFQQRPVTDTKFKITCMDYFNKQIYAGDNTGTIYKFPLQFDQSEIFQSNTEVKKQIAGKKSNVTLIKAIYCGNLLVIADEQFYYIDGKTLQLKGDNSVNYTGIQQVYINEKLNKQNEIALINKKKDAIFLTINLNNQDMQPDGRVLKLYDIPVTVAFMGQILYVGYSKKDYQMINVDNSQLNQLNIPIPNNPLIKVTAQDELLILTTNNTGLFIELDGQMRTKNTLNLPQNKIIQQVTIVQPYLVVLLDNSLQIFNLADAKPMQEITFQGNQQIKGMTNSISELFYYLQTEILYLQKTPYDYQILKSMQDGRYDDAFSIFDQHVAVNDPERKQKLDQLKMEASWSMIRNLEFDKAKQQMMELNFDPRELISLFPDLIPMSKKIFKDDKKIISIQFIIQERLQKLNYQKKEGDINKQTQDYKNKSKEFLSDLLENRRNKYTQSTIKDNLKDKQDFLSVKESINGHDLGKISNEDLLELIDFVLIKLYVDLSQNGKLKQLLQGQPPFGNAVIYCKSLYNELEPFIIKYIQQQDNILAFFYESFDKINLALDKWKAIGQSQDNKTQLHASSEIVRILIKNHEQDLIKKYLEWIIKNNNTMNTGCNLFKDIPLESFPPNDALTWFQQIEPNVDKFNRIKEAYLEVIVIERHHDDQRFHTLLALSYLENIFAIEPKDKKTEINQINNQVVKNNYEKLKQFLNNPQARYVSATLLEKIKDSWLIEEEIFLYNKEKRHEEAIKKLVRSQKFKLAELYCIKSQDKLLTILFSKIIELYIDCIQKIPQYQEQQKPEQLKKIKNIADQLREYLDGFLKKYATHSQLDPLQVLQLIPEDWILAESGSPQSGYGDGLYSFLQSVISHTLHQKRSMKSAKSLSDMDQLNVECNLIKAKQAHIKITTDRKCVCCQRSIGDKAFAVYPNAVVAHEYCVKNKGFTVCPVTGQDFEKTFKG